MNLVALLVVLAIYAVLNVVVFFLVQAILKLVDWRRKAASEFGAKCGGCGYPCRGISTFQCPECGADLREVGMRL